MIVMHVIGSKELVLLLACVLIANGGNQYHGGPTNTAVTGISGSCAVGSCGPDFNPVLLQGQRGYPGIRARLNARAFQYASGILNDVLNTEIKRARIPPITQCIPQVQGCVQIYNLYVSRYRCPQRVVLYPAAPNQIVLQVQNVDLGVTGNLGGQIVILLPIALTGIVQLNVHQATITVSMVIERGAQGPYVRIQSCNVHIGYADAYIENGGLIGDIINSQFRQRISNQVRHMIPGQICGQLPSIVNEKLNSKLSRLPQAIAVSQMLSMFGGALGLGGPTPSAQYCQSQCPASQTISTNTQPPAPIILPSVSSSTASAAAPPAPQIPTGAYVEEKVVARGIQQQVVYSTKERPTIVKRVPTNSIPIRLPLASENSLKFRQNRSVDDNEKMGYVPSIRSKRQAITQRLYRVTNLAPATAISSRIVRHNEQYPTGYIGSQGANIPRLPPPPPVPSAPAPHYVPAPSHLCSQCPTGGQEDPASFIKQLAGHLDMSKLNDLYLSVQLLNTYATSNDFTVDLTGEFSPGGQGGTPFGPFPTSFPSIYDDHMVEFILTDYTINTLFYQLHRKQFLTFRIGPDTPKIGDLLKTTCNEDEDDELEATEVELDEEASRRRLRKSLSATKIFRVRRTSVDHRGKRQDEAGGLADLGICFGDILPAVRERYPNKKIAVQIRTVRAPSVILSQAKGGTATLDLIADADIYIDGTNTKVGTITIAATVVVVAQVRGNRLSGSAQITNLKLTDRTGSLGLPQDALDNLGNLGKELLQKLINDSLSKGIAINLPSGGIGLPVNIINPSVRIIEHGLYIATDITVSPSLLGVGGGGSC